MNKFNTSGWIIAMILLSILAGCNTPSASTQKEKTMAIDSVVLHRTEHLMNDTAKPKCSIELVIQYPKSIEGIQDLAPILNEMVIGTFGEEYVNLSVQEAAGKFVDKFVADYRGIEKEYQDFEKQFGKGASIPTFSYESAVNTRITYCGGNLFSFQVYNFSFTGGAHGNYSYNNFSWNTTTNRLIKQEDLFVENSTNDINRIIRETLAKQYNVPQGEKLEENGFFNDSEIAANNNILLDNSSITWIYNPYEIAPYSTGSPTVKIPYADLALFFKEETPISVFLKK